jgi:hypothetical protein
VASLTVGRLVARPVVVVALFALVLLVPAGTWRWPEAWILLALYLAFAVPVGTWLFRTNPELLAQRAVHAPRPSCWSAGSTCC